MFSFRAMIVEFAAEPSGDLPSLSYTKEGTIQFLSIGHSTNSLSAVSEGASGIPLLALTVDSKLEGDEGFQPHKENDKVRICCRPPEMKLEEAGLLRREFTYN